MLRASRFAPLALALALLTCASHAPEDRGAVPQPGGRTSPQWNNDWSRGGVFYEVFVRSFADSNGDGIGDLDGLISRLDYLNDGKPETTSDLGVDALWLMPVFKSPSYHGYDTTDYETINPDYGTNGGFQRLLAEAHKRGIRVIVDLVLNHTGSDHPWFVESSSSPTSPKRNWYVWSAADLGWKQPWGGSQGTWYQKNGAYYYAVFWSGMPDLNYTTPAVRETMKRVAALWLDRGVDGFRLDATRYVIETGGGQTAQQDTPPTHAFLKELSSYVRQIRSDAMLVGENWTDTPTIATYYGSPAVPGGDELPMSFDFPLADAILRGVTAGNASGIAAKLDEVKRLYPAGAADAPFLTNHDQVRLATQLGSDRGKLGSAAAILLSVPGSPFLYYGEEVGLQNGPTNGDESKRTPMPWTNGGAGGGFTTGNPWFGFAPGRETANVAAQTDDPASLLSRYRNLIRARKSSPALTRGDVQLLSPLSGTSGALAFLRVKDTERVLVVHNLSGGILTAGPYPVTASGFERIFADPGVSDPTGGGSLSVFLPPRTTGIWRLK